MFLYPAHIIACFLLPRRHCRRRDQPHQPHQLYLPWPCLALPCPALPCSATLCASVRASCARLARACFAYWRDRRRGTPRLIERSCFVDVFCRKMSAAALLSPPQLLPQELALLQRGTVRVLSIDPGVRNLGIWLGTVDVADLRQTTEVWRVVDVVARQQLTWPSLNDHTIPECCDVVDAYLESPECDVPKGAPIDIVLIEQQATNTSGKFGRPAAAAAGGSESQKKQGAAGPGGVAQVRMFGVSLTMRQTLRRQFPHAYMAPFVSAKLKLQLLDDRAKADAKAEPNRAKRRKIHKTRTIAIVENLAGVPQDQGHKLDDLADCWLQARAWVHVRRALRDKLAARAARTAAAEEKKAQAAAKKLHTQAARALKAAATQAAKAGKTGATKKPGTKKPAAKLGTKAGTSAETGAGAGAEAGAEAGAGASAEAGASAGAGAGAGAGASAGTAVRNAAVTAARPKKKRPFSAVPASAAQGP